MLAFRPFLTVICLVLAMGAVTACSEDSQKSNDTGEGDQDSEFEQIHDTATIGEQDTGPAEDTNPEDTAGEDDDTSPAEIDTATLDDDTATEDDDNDTATDDTDSNPPEDGTPCAPWMLDPFTGLCWHTILDPDSTHGWPVSAKYDEAKKHCDDLDMNGWLDWRLPTIDEHRANIIVACEDTTLGGPCDVRVDCDYYPFLDDCVAFDGSMDDRTNCDSCDWLYTPYCKWHIDLNNNCASSYWSNTLIQDGTDSRYYTMNYSGGNIWQSGSFGNFVACVREEQPLDERAARLPVVETIEGNGCDEDDSTPICLMLEGSDFGPQDPDTDPLTEIGWYFDGRSCVSTQYNINDFCLFPSDIECAKSCAAAGECNVKRLDRDLVGIWNNRAGFASGGTESLAGGWICSDETLGTVLEDMYPADTLVYREFSSCPDGDARYNLIDDPHASPPEPYTTIDATEWEQLCGYTLLPWVSYITGLKFLP